MKKPLHFLQKKKKNSFHNTSHNQLRSKGMEIGKSPLFWVNWKLFISDILKLEPHPAMPGKKKKKTKKLKKNF